MHYTKPIPVPNHGTQSFWDGCRQHQLKFQQCVECVTVNWPPSYLCSHCLSVRFDWIVSKGVGKIYTYVTYYRAFHSSFKDDLPYISAVVELDEGPRILTNIVNCSLSEVECEMRVIVEWDDITSEYSLPKFRPLLSG
jgi:uncharacterized OB-fold protein